MSLIFFPFSYTQHFSTSPSDFGLALVFYSTLIAEDVFVYGSIPYLPERLGGLQNLLNILNTIAIWMFQSICTMLDGEECKAEI